MRRWITALLLLLAGLNARAAEFAVFDVYVDSGTERLAAYQLKVSDERAAVKIVSVEGGEHASFREAPKFDAKAIQRDVIKIAAFSLDEREKLPTGRVRVASLHVEIGPGLTPEWMAVVEAAARPGGGKISAKVSISKRENQ
ncbi:MAG: hypothetical protein ACXW32_15565 [Limisphaerales bacterium]